MDAENKIIILINEEKKRVVTKRNNKNSNDFKVDTQIKRRKKIIINKYLKAIFQKSTKLWAIYRKKKKVNEMK